MRTLAPAEQLACRARGRQRQQRPRPCAASFAEWEGWAALRAHVMDAGGHIHPAVVAGTADGVRGLFAAAPVAAGTVLVTLPPACCVDESSCDAGLWARLSRTEPQLANAPGWERIALHLLLRSVRGQVDPYLNALATVAPGFVDSFPQSWTSGQRAQLQSPRFEAALAARAARAELLLRALKAVLPEAAGLLLRDVLRWQALVHSRSYGLRTTSMEPVMDMLNHAPFAWPLPADAALPTHNVQHAYGAELLASLVALKALAPGVELLNCYSGQRAGGQLTAEGSLMTYGFLPGGPGSLAYEPAAEDPLTPPFSLACYVEREAAAGVAEAELLPSALRAFGRAAFADAFAADCAAQDAGETPGRLAAQYRRERGLQLRRTALSWLSAEELVGLSEGVAEGEQACGGSRGLGERVLQALAGRAARVTPAEAYRAETTR